MAQPANTHATPKAVDACHELLLWLIPQLNKFPRNHRFTLGDRIECALLDVLEALVAAARGMHRIPFLRHESTECLKKVRNAYPTPKPKI